MSNNDKQLNLRERMISKLSKHDQEIGFMDLTTRTKGGLKRFENILTPSFLDTKWYSGFCNEIIENVRLGKDNCTIINFAARWQAINGREHPITSGTSISFARKDADPIYFVLDEKDALDMLIFIGFNHTGETHGFIISREAAGEDYLCELDSFYSLAVVKRPTYEKELGVMNYLGDGKLLTNIYKEKPIIERIRQYIDDDAKQLAGEAAKKKQETTKMPKKATY